MIAANLAQLMTLIATNILGQNTPAIAATEAQYAEMWAQDVVAMYGYAASSAVATQLSPFTEPHQTTSPSALSGQSAAVAQAAATPDGSQQSTLAQLISAPPNTLQGLASPTSSGTGFNSVLNGLGLDIFAPGSGSEGTGLAGLLHLVSASNGSAAGSLLNADIWNTIFSSGFYMPGNFLGNVSDFMGLAGGKPPNKPSAISPKARLVKRWPLRWATCLRWATRCQPAWAAPHRSARCRCHTARLPPRQCTPTVVGAGATPMVGPPAVAAGMPRYRWAPRPANPTAAPYPNTVSGPRLSHAHRCRMTSRVARDRLGGDIGPLRQSFNRAASTRPRCSDRNSQLLEPTPVYLPANFQL